MLHFAAILCFAIGLAHSYLGERYILIRLFRRDNLPKLFGDDSFTKNTLRFAWHIMSVLGWGYGFMLWQIGNSGYIAARTLLLTTSAVFLICGLLAFGFSRGKHLSWIVFGSIAAIVFYAGMSL